MKLSQIVTEAIQHAENHRKYISVQLDVNKLNVWLESGELYVFSVSNIVDHDALLNALLKDIAAQAKQAA